MRTSETTPTISTVKGCGRSKTILPPTADSRAKCLRANVSFTSATGGVSAPSDGVNARPSFSEIASARKYSGLVAFNSARGSWPFSGISRPSMRNAVAP